MEYVLSIIGLPEYSLKRAFAPLGDFARHVHDHFIPNHRNNYHPHLLGQRSLALMSGLLVTVKIFTIGVVSLGPVTAVFSSAITQQNIISLTNQSRQAYGLGVLKPNSILDSAAQAKANDMLAKGYFAHTTPDGKSPWDFVTAAGYSYLQAGENLAVNFTEAENVETAWMNSPGHKANILNKNFQEIGIGIAQGEYQGHSAIFVVQMFGTPVEQKVAISDVPTQVQVEAVPQPQPAIVPPVVKKPTPSQPKSGAVLGKDQPQAKPASPLPEDSKAALVPPQPVVVESGEVQLEGENINITAIVTGAAVKVMAYFGEQAIMLSPKDQNIWTGQVPLKTVAQSNQTVKLKAFGMDGKDNQLQLANFSTSTQENYNLSGTTPTTNVTLLNKSFDPKSAESRFYLLFIAGLLSSLILAIAIKKHVQHVNLIANTSFVAIFAALLLWIG